MQILNNTSPIENVVGYRMSPQQEHLWRLKSITQDNHYIAQCAVSIDGKLDVEILKKSLQDVVNQHEILRTSFQCLPGMAIPLQVIADSQDISINYYDGSDFDAEEKDNKIDLFLTRHKFNNSNLSQIDLIKSVPNQHILLVSLPAMIADAIGIRNWVHEVSRSYTTNINNQQSSDEVLQYADIAEWQHELLTAEDVNLGKAYWKQQEFPNLFDIRPPFEKKVAEDVVVFEPKTFRLELGKNFLVDIQNILQKPTDSLADFLLTCWQIVLWRNLDKPDIVVGRLYDGRKHQELQAVIGLFAKYLPLASHLQPDLLFKQLWQQVQESVSQAHQWQDYFSWQEYSKNLAIDFLPYCFEFTEQAQQASVDTLTFNLYKEYACIDRFKLKLSCIRQQDDLVVNLYYDAKLFPLEDIQRLAAQFQQLLSSVIYNPDAAISELEILNDCELQQVLFEFNNTQVDYNRSQLIHQLFEAQAESVPDNIAVVVNNQQLTYRELNERANQLAHYLHKLGVQAEVFVGICVERSLSMAIGILAILKAGGAYVPLDPTYPSERLQFILQDTQTPVLLTQQSLLQDLLETQAKIICLDADWEIIASESHNNPAVAMTSANLAYIIYTSGSTGKPKGVQITHQNLVNSTQARLNYYQEPVGSFLLLSSFAFDSSVAGIFWTLCSGGTLVFPQVGGEQDISYLLNLISQNQVTHLLSLPSLYNVILEQANQQELVSLRSVIVAGESCSAELVIRHLEKLPQVALFNEYGPTETTVWSTVYHCCSPEIGNSVSIGRPITNAQIYLLDRNLHPVPLGVAGEVYIGGDGLARGYLNRPDLTAERFIRNPFEEVEGSRLYKTGDLARYLADGNIEFLGRIDQQIKIRGFRIELGEIEAVLKRNPAVDEVIVVARSESKSYFQNEDSYIDPKNTEILVTKILSLGQEYAEQHLAEIEKLSEDELEIILAQEITGQDVKEILVNSAVENHRSRRLRQFSNFYICLEIDENFINPPQKFQRNWLLKQSIDELADDLIHLDALSRRFVAGNQTTSKQAESSTSIFESQQIMEDWQIPLMQAMANIITETHSNVLEVGFGRGVSASLIQDKGVKSHTIIECDDAVSEAFYHWKTHYTEQDIRLVKGKWQEVKDQLGIYDGIFFHANILNEEQLLEDVVESVTFAEHFFPTAVEHLREGGVFTYLTHEIDSFSRRHQRLVLKYFSSLTLSIVEPLSLPEDTKDLWWADSMVVVKCIK
ncbi:amino acid adenylation domain-containing protein [uncultured Nostoc sp.]|uniref:amino acid adenylation domain-containing protein n=1 Tax=uncultured Nostoc sp. TaxID=340711 RepID=UPI0026179331|nr:amino acid adenylation domain-containing protein [uncultured Nostoc sp.]